MKWGKFFLVILFIVIIVGAIAAYFLYEKPIQETTNEFISVNIKAIDVATNKNIKTGYKIFIDNNLFDKGTTNTQAFLMRKIPLNKTIIVHNYNLENQMYYLYKHPFDTYNETKSERVVLKLILPGELSFEQKGVFGIDKQINLNVISSGEFRNMIFCIRYSMHILYIEAINFTETDKIENFNKCFVGKNLLNEENITISIKYETFGVVDKNDFINISFFDVYFEPFTEEAKKNERAFYEIKL